ncbi:hypothetical protein Poli38472_012328 [Pythium oligandrum]|uniref:Uncharacterized protein n=1 Tax=Pythium oligandrum TaxID=41045 RepID=A0A8K1CR82_PYTOL|nr:hypothetical protein Poli38472_012328 [Pythium oligandrum]|eukprot:TMW67212.1 hypothetical protein Poli38472_012328 [Pythium oligandrum]
MPLMTPDFQYVEGKFKIPFLRGEMDSTMDKFRDIESMYTQDLSAWLCNLYFQVTVLREDIERLILRSERLNAAYDVEVDERNGLFQLPPGSCDELRARKKSAGDNDDRKPGNLLTQTPTSTSATQLIEDSDGHKDGSPRRGVLGHFWSKHKKSNRVYSGGVVVPENEEPGFVHEEAGQIAPPVLSDAKVVSPYSGLTLNRSDSINNRSQSVPTIDEEDNEDRDRGTLSRLDIENHSFSVNSAFARETAHHQRFHTTRKLHYLRHELFVDMGVSNVRTMEFWLLLAVFAFTLWLRVYVHYIMQWVFLKGNRIPVFYFQPQWSTCMVKYTWKTVATHTEIGVIVFGVLGNWFLFGFLALTAAISQVYVGELPHFGSKFMVCIGIATVLDPYLVFLVDLVNHQYDCGSRMDCLESLTARTCKCVNGDAFKLYYRFLAQEGSGLVGAIIAVIIYAALTCLSLVVFYSYLLHVHMNGRMLDVYRRIHSHENDLFIPHDCEISLQELQAICIQAGRWKGPRGTQRKVFVHDYVLQDPLDPNFQEKSTHIALYNIELDGRRELYRHFLKSHDGAIVELFGEIGPSANGTWQQDAGPGVASITLLYNILQDQATASDATPAADLTALFEGLS